MSERFRSAVQNLTAQAFVQGWHASQGGSSCSAAFSDWWRTYEPGILRELETASDRVPAVATQKGSPEDGS